VIARQLALAGYASESADDGEHGLVRWRSGRYALVLTDVHMPKLDGYQLARAIREEEAREHRPHTPIVALTASAMKGEAERCIAAGMDDYLASPSAFRPSSRCSDAGCRTRRRTRAGGGPGRDAPARPSDRHPSMPRCSRPGPWRCGGNARAARRLPRQHARRPGDAASRALGRGTFPA
jgi:CheY-like chemotaxis protein